MTCVSRCFDDEHGRVQERAGGRQRRQWSDSLVRITLRTRTTTRPTSYVHIKDVPLPPLSSAVELADETSNLPPWLQGVAVANLANRARSIFRSRRPRADGTSSSCSIPPTRSPTFSNDRLRALLYTRCCYCSRPHWSPACLSGALPVRSRICRLPRDALPAATSTFECRLNAAMKWARWLPPSTR